MIEEIYYPTLDSFVKKNFQDETIISSCKKRVRINSFIKVRNFRREKTEHGLYEYQIVETDKKIFIYKNRSIDVLNYFVIDKKDIKNTEEEIKDGVVFKKITMIPKRMFEFEIYHFTDINPAPQYFIARFIYNIKKVFDKLFGFMFVKMTTEITY